MRNFFLLFLICLLFLTINHTNSCIAYQKSSNSNSQSVKQRIISLAPSITEILFALGLNKEIIAVSNFSNFPKEAEKKEKIDGINLSIEKILNLKPDLVVGTEQNNLQIIEKLKKLGVPVYLVEQNNLKDLISSIKNLGVICGKIQEAEKITNQINQTIEIIKKDHPSIMPKVFLIVWPEPLIVSGKDTFQDDLIKIAGGENLGSKLVGKYPQISYEFMIKSNPDVIIIPHDIEKIFRNTIKNNRFLNEVKAIKENKILVVNGDILSRPGPRIIEALKLIHQYFQNLKNE